MIRDRETLKTFPRSIRRHAVRGLGYHPLHSVPVEDRRAWRNQLKRERRERRAAR